MSFAQVDSAHGDRGETRLACPATSLPRCPGLTSCGGETSAGSSPCGERVAFVADRVSGPARRLGALMAPARSSFVVAFDSEATQELVELIKSKEERKAIFNALDKLRQLGPSLV